MIFRAIEDCGRFCLHSFADSTQQALIDGVRRVLDPLPSDITQTAVTIVVVCLSRHTVVVAICVPVCGEAMTRQINVIPAAQVFGMKVHDTWAKRIFVDDRANF